MNKIKQQIFTFLLLATLGTQLLAMGNQPSAIQFQPAIDARNDKLADASHSRYLASEEAKFIRESEQEVESARVSGHLSTGTQNLWPERNLPFVL